MKVSAEISSVLRPPLSGQPKQIDTEICDHSSNAPIHAIRATQGK